MLRIGLIDLDTSHARAFANLLPRLDPDARVTGVCDAARVRSVEQVDTFCREHGCRRYDSLASLAQEVDAAMVLSADWEAHLPRARPLLEAGVPTYVDKPLAGSVEELHAFIELAQHTGTPLLSGSGYRFNAPIREARQSWADRAMNQVFVMTPFDPFFYGAHAPNLVLGLLGPGIEAVRRCDGNERLLWFKHRRGIEGHMLLEAPRLFWGVLFNAEGKQHCVSFDVRQIHQGICRRVIDMTRTGRAPLTPTELIEPAMAMLAGLHPEAGSRAVRLDELPEDLRHPNEPFMRDYIAASSPSTLLAT